MNYPVTLSHLSSLTLCIELAISWCLFVSSPSGIPIKWMLVCLMLSQRSLKLFWLLIFFSFCYSDWVVSIILSSRSLMLSSVSPSLLFIPPSVFFIFVILFFGSDWFFFIFSCSLLKCVHLFFSLIQFLILITNALDSLSSKLFTSVSFIFIRVSTLLLHLVCVSLSSHFA